MTYNVYAKDTSGNRFVIGAGMEIHAAEYLAEFTANYGGWAPLGVSIEPRRPILAGDTATVFRSIVCEPEGEHELTQIEYVAGDTVMVLKVDGERAKVTTHGTCPRWVPLDNLAK